jgi:hypothetical protein
VKLWDAESAASNRSLRLGVVGDRGHASSSDGTNPKAEQEQEEDYDQEEDEEHDKDEE